MVLAAERWLEAVWPVVSAWLPAPPARVLEIGCGSRGGFVPKLRSIGFDAIGVDPDAPKGVEYSQSQFERAAIRPGFDVVVASTSLHHVGEPAEVMNRLETVLSESGVVVVIEWAWEDFDEPTAQWAFARLDPGKDAGWLQRRRDDWLASEQEWGAYLRGWAESEGIHSSASLLRLLDHSFEPQHLYRGPYLFPDLAGTSQEDELAAIEAGDIRPLRVDYVGRARR